MSIFYQEYPMLIEVLCGWYSGWNFGPNSRLFYRNFTDKTNVKTNQSEMVNTLKKELESFFRTESSYM